MNTLIVVDMQNDFVDGALGTGEAQAILLNVRAKIQQYAGCGDKIIFTRDSHNSDYPDTPEGKKLPVPHCIRNTYGWQIEESLLEGLDQRLCSFIDKPTFGYNGWDKVEIPGDIEIIGLCTDICVVTNALILKTIYPDKEITVDSSCCAGTCIETHKAALTVMKSCQINII